jgi:DNA-binding CsgD family transcriptional regulator
MWDPGVVLLGREPEVARIDRALVDARRGVSSALVFRGEPGIGKTALLRHARSAAGEMQVLSARGTKFEADLAFAGLHELLRPALPAVDRLPPALAGALGAALGLRERTDSDRFLIGAATLELLTAWAETPLLVLVDDAHWLDQASADAIAFAARRLLADPVALLITTLEDEPSPLLAAGLEEVRLRGLDQTSAAELLRSASPQPLPAHVARRIVETSGGNPLAMVEMAAEAHRYEVTNGFASVPLPIATTVERAYLRRLTQISESARSAMLLMAASGSASADLVRRAAVELRLPPEAVEEAEGTTGLVVSSGRELRFVHPLAAAAVYHAASPSARRAAHRALAAAMSEPGTEDRRAWHLSSAADRPNEEVAVELEAAARRALDRMGHAAAAASFEQAARLSTTTDARARRLFAAAESAWLAGQAERAVAVLAETRSIAAEATLAVEVEALAGRIALLQGAVADGYRMIGGAAAQLVGRDRLRAIELLAEASLVGFGAGCVADMLASARRALDLLHPGDPHRTQIAAHVAYGCAAVLAAIDVEGPRHLRTAEALFQATEMDGDPLLLFCAAVVGLFLREAEAGRQLLERAHTSARKHAPASALPQVLFHLGRDLATTDEWSAARAHYEEGVRLARETDQHNLLSGLLAGLAQLDALEGRTAELQRRVAEVEVLADRYQMECFRAWAVTAQAMHALTAGELDEARDRLELVRALHRRLGIRDPDVDPAADLVEVHARLGDYDSAREEAAMFHATASLKGQPYALARAERALGLVAPEGELASHFEAALAYHARTRDSFEAARTRLSYGARLRRVRRRGDARRQLAEALRAFDQLGAAPWSRLALAELGAGGDVVGRRDETVRHRLTPQELQVAFTLAQGYTTKEAAARLFLSAKTVEYHLRNVYDKLEIHSREELRAVMGPSSGGYTAAFLPPPTT